VIAELELKVKNMRVYREKVEAATWDGVDQAHRFLLMLTVIWARRRLPSISEKGRWGLASLDGCRRS
jgi:hypothetical protein